MTKNEQTRVAIFPGTFDPVTNGHIDVVERGCKIFDKIIVAVAHSRQKTPLFTADERVAIAREVLKDFDSVEVDAFGTVLADYVRSKGTNLILRGIRTLSDFEAELQIALVTKTIDKNLETVFVMTSAKNSFISSHIIKDIVRVGGDARKFVPDFVHQKLQEKLNGK